MLKIKKDFVLRTVAESIVVVPVGKRSLDFNGMITLNKTGEFLWKMLEAGADMTSLEQALAEKYGIDADTARKDTGDFIEMLKGADLLE